MTVMQLKGHEKDLKHVFMWFNLATARVYNYGTTRPSTVISNATGFSITFEDV